MKELVVGYESEWGMEYFTIKSKQDIAKLKRNKTVREEIFATDSSGIYEIDGVDCLFTPEQLKIEDLYDLEEFFEVEDYAIGIDEQDLYENILERFSHRKDSFFPKEPNAMYRKFNGKPYSHSLFRSILSYIGKNFSLIKDVGTGAILVICNWK